MWNSIESSKVSRNLLWGRQWLIAFVLLGSALPVHGDSPSLNMEEFYRMQQVTVDEEGTIHTDNSILPVSRLISPQAQKAMKESLFKGSKFGIYTAYKECGALDNFNNPAMLLKARECFLRKMDLPAKIEQLRKMYPVIIETAKINGIEVDIVTPKEGVSRSNQNKVLLQIHGSGTFIDHPDMRKESSISVASLGKIKVIGVDHRLAPEAKWPAALEDITQVYKTLLKTYPPKNIGIYGCSAGASFTASMIPWLSKVGLPIPGAIAMQGEGASSEILGDSWYTTSSFGKTPFVKVMPYDQTIVEAFYYFSGMEMDPYDRIYAPLFYLEMAAKFPPTIVMNSMRDSTVSQAVHDHRALLQAGVEAELHIWDGLPHCFQEEFPEIPEAREYHLQMLTFFDKHLGNTALTGE